MCLYVKQQVVTDRASTSDPKLELDKLTLYYPLINYVEIRLSVYVSVYILCHDCIFFA